MWALEDRVPETGEPLAAGTPIATVCALGVALSATALLVPAGGLPRAALGVVALTTGHGALLATALAWTAWDDTPRWDPRPAIVSILFAVALAATLAASAAPAGALAYATPLGVYGLLAARGRLRSFGGPRPLALSPALLGCGIGAALGGHLLLSASLTLGYRLRADGAAAYLAAIAYDLGVSVVSAELFFRGALLRRALARWSLGAAIAATTAAGVLRYLVDPLLPHAPEAVAGAALYLTLLGVANAWLVAASGSVVPALASSMLFFAAYRLVVG